MNIKQLFLAISTAGRGTQDITNKLNDVITELNITTGLCNLFLQHTSASLLICENYDVQVRKDLEHFFARLVPDGDPLFKHTIEGKDDMPAHVRTILTQTSLQVPIANKTLLLGTWQGIFLYEHRYAPQERNLVLTFLYS